MLRKKTKSEVRVRSWSELNDVLFADSWREDIARFRSNFAFRGARRVHDDLTTSLHRGGYVPQEVHMLRNFRKYASQSEIAGDSIWNWLALAQHHGLPTRLLDWTYSPFVALHFATARLDQLDTEGVVWCFDYVAAARLLPKRLRALLEKEGSYVFTAELLDQVARSLQELQRLSPREFVIFFEPPSFDQRIVNQFALFSLVSKPRASLDRWLATHPDLYRRIVLPPEVKREVRDKLDQANITERVLFPGLDGLTSWLKRYYAPKLAPLADEEDDEPTPTKEEMRKKQR